MRNFLPKHLRKPVPKMSRPMLEAAQRYLEEHKSEDPDTHSNHHTMPKSDERSTYANTLDPTP